MKKHIRRRAIFSFGESINDAKVLKEIIAAVRSDLPVVEAKPRPIMLSRDADLQKHRQRAGEIARMLRAAQVTYEVVAVVAHRDLDDLEPANFLTESSRDEESLRSALQAVSDLGVQVIVTSPAWEMEAWWLMWPEQVAKHRPSWKKLKDRSSKRVDRIRNVKEVLRRELRPQDDPKIPVYSENDSSYIASIIRRDGQIRLPQGKSIAFERLLKNLDALIN